jgi:hypothetical protein
VSPHAAPAASISSLFGNRLRHYSKTYLSLPLTTTRCGVEIWRGGTRVLRFQIPLIKPDLRISRIRLSDKGYLAFAHGRFVLKRARRTRPSFA